MFFVVLGVINAVTLWLKDIRYFSVSYCVLLLFSLYAGLVDWLGVISIIVFAFALRLYSLRDKFSLLSFTALLVLGLLYGMHLMPGFEGFRFLSNIELSPVSASFDIWFSFDKFNFGVLVIFFVFRDELIRSLSQLSSAIRSVALWAIPSIILIYLLAIFINYSQFDVTFSSIFFPWVIKNLFFTVLAEEVFFRGLIQRELTIRLGSRYSHLPVVLAGVLFGVAHFAGGLQYVFLSALAGVIYGYCYKISGRLEMSILAHLTLNSAHFLFFAYPHSAL